MGSSLSCLDGGRTDQSPSSWPKDHPGRAEAIAEYKARRSPGKFARKSDAPVVAAAAATGAAAAAGTAAAVASRSVDEDETKPEVDVDAKTETKVDDITDVSPDAVVEEEVVSERETTLVDEEVAESPPPPAEEPVVEEPKVEETEIEEKEVPTTPEPVEPEAKADEEDVASAEAVTDTPDYVVGAEKGEVSSNMMAQRAIFENTPDDLPEAKNVAKDVLDPVTGEFVTLAEYRQLQKERLDGVVKEQVDKYEEMDEAAMKVAATEKLQMEARASGPKVRSWTKPDGSSNPSSPLSPSKPGTFDASPLKNGAMEYTTGMSPEKEGKTDLEPAKNGTLDLPFGDKSPVKKSEVEA